MTVEIYEYFSFLEFIKTDVVNITFHFYYPIHGRGRSLAITSESSAIFTSSTT